MAVIANKDDDLKYKKQQIELFFSVHSDQQERADYLKSAYQDRYTEIIADGQRLGYKPQEDGLLMWEGSYLSRTKESVFSWDLVARWTAQLIDKKEYFIQTDIRQLPTQESQQMTLFDFSSFGSSTPSEGEQQRFLFPRQELSQQVIDEAMQIFGATGISQDTPLAHMWMNARMLRFADGPDAVHRRVIGRAELRKHRAD